MRKMIITIGLPGSGKSTWARENYPEILIHSKDKIREMFYGLDVNDNGLCIKQYSRQYPMKKIEKEILVNKMKQGQLIVIDGTCCNENQMATYHNLAKQWNYSLEVKDFRHVSIEQCKKWNKKRASYKVVPDEVIDQMNEIIQYDVNPYIIDKRDYKYITSASNKVHFIGDIQGCGDAFRKLETWIFEQPNTDEFVFLGDWLDRGDDNGYVLKSLMSKKFKNDRFHFIFGNHELVLLNYINGEKSGYKEFDDYTGSQIENLDKKAIRTLLNRCYDYIYFTHKPNVGNVQLYFVSHGGNPDKDFDFISGVDEQIPAFWFWTGHKDYDFDIDNLLENRYYRIIHGHRNLYNHDVFVNGNVNLEGGVERGGSIRVATFGNGKAPTATFFKNDFPREEIVNGHEAFVKSKGVKKSDYCF